MGEQSMTIMLNGSDLTVTQVVAAARHGETVALAPGAIAAMRQARAVVQEALRTGQPVYGLTTGVGERKSFLLDPAERQRFNRRPGAARGAGRPRRPRTGKDCLDPPGQQGPVTEPRPVRIGESFVGEGAEAAHINLY
jgi:Aromatic amino acid lyase